MRIVSIPWAVAVLLTALLSAQTYYGTIRGTVVDTTGAVNPGVQVTITNVDTNIRTIAVSNETGNYMAPNLVPGTYRVTAEKTGFKTFVVDDVQLVSAADRRVDVVFQLGALAEAVTVTAGAQLIETERGTISDVKPLEVYRNMAVVSNYRSIWRMLAVSPGVSGDGSIYAGNGAGRNTTYSIDGIPIKDGWTGSSFSPALTYLDSYREFRVEMVSVNATGGTSSNVSVVSESGTNALHGEGWLHYNAIGFAARPFFSPARASGPPIYRPNVKIGGPVKLGPLYDGKDRTFWHFTWQGIRGSQVPSVTNIVVPTSDFRAGNFSSIAGTLIDPLTEIPFPDKVIPASRISPVSRYYQEEFYPLPNSGTDRYADISVSPNRSDQYAVRIDHRLSDKNSLFGRYLFQNYTFERWDGDFNPKIGIYDQWRHQNHLVLSDTHVVSPTAVNEFRFGWAEDHSVYGGPRRGMDVARASGLDLQDLQDSKGLPRMDITGFQSLFQADQGGWQWNTFHVIETLHYTRGKHNFRFGFQYGRYKGINIATSPSRTFGVYDFNGRFSGDPYADFLLGIPNTSSRSTSLGEVYPLRSTWEGFFTDDFKVSRRLSLNFGVRYSLLHPGTIERDVMANFSPLHNALIVPDEAAKALVHPGFPKDVPIITADQAGLGRSLLKLDKNNFAPRVGFAWRPGLSDDLVVRGGAGIYYIAMQPYVSDGGGAPFELDESFTNSITDGVPAFQFPHPFPAAGYVLGGTSASGMNPYMRTPYSTQYNFTVEKQAFDMGISLSYIGTLSRKNPYSRNLNQPVANAIPYADKVALRPFAYLDAADFTDNGGSHSYHGGILKAERRMKNGFYYQAHLTFAKSMGDDWGGMEDAFDRRSARSQGGTIRRWRGVVISLYELPFGRGRKFGATMPAVLDHVVGNWTVAGTYVWNTGAYFTPAFSGSDPSNTNNFGGRPDRIADGNLSEDQRTLQRWFDTAAFVAPPAGAGRFGNSGTYIVEGPGLSVFHFGVNKEVALMERVRLRLEMTSTNFLNHPNFSNPAVTIGTSTYGRITSTVGTDGNRDFQLTARIIF
jgi:hypothetical protein